MKAALFLLAISFTSLHAVGRAELACGISFLQSDLKAPGVPRLSGLTPYTNGSLKWVWPRGFKLGLKVLTPFRAPFSSGSSVISVPSVLLPEVLPMNSCFVMEMKSICKVLLPRAQFLELTLPLRCSEVVSLSASLGIGRADWSGGVLGTVVSFDGQPDLYIVYGICEKRFAWSGLFSLDWNVRPPFALSIYGGYMSLGKLDFGGMRGFKSDVGGMIFGLALSCKL